MLESLKYDKKGRDAIIKIIDNLMRTESKPKIQHSDISQIINQLQILVDPNEDDFVEKTEAKKIYEDLIKEVRVMNLAVKKFFFG